ncbi:MAG: flagellar protein FlaG [bacterium]|nr:flagellar protein FlaG [bacterium]
MIENVSVNKNDQIIDKGGGQAPPQPPSSTEVISDIKSNQPAAVIDLQSRVAEKADRDSGELKKEDTSPDEEIKNAVDALNEKLTRLDHEVQFKLDKKTGKNYISVIDKESKEVIREFPPKEIRAFIARFDEINEQMLTSSPDIKSLIINLEV